MRLTAVEILKNFGPGDGTFYTIGFEYPFEINRARELQRLGLVRIIEQPKKVIERAPEEKSDEPKVNPEWQRLRNAGEKVARIASRFGVSRGTIYNYTTRPEAGNA